MDWLFVGIGHKIKKGQTQNNDGHEQLKSQNSEKHKRFYRFSPRICYASASRDNQVK